jgi:XTP/dITP diphosphohydrolase
MTPIVLATRNRHKAAELEFFLRGLPVQVLTLNEIAQDAELREDGATFHANAAQKASIVHAATGHLALADDSGLEVFYLNGRPGVFSARYAGPSATDEENNEKLLAQMRGVPPRRRHAQFRSVLALADGRTQEFTEGSCPGRLAESPRGTNGFGYDPIFIPDGFDRTYAELTSEEKNRISHRSRAFAGMRHVLMRRFGV